MLRAASLAYAIFITLIIAILCYSILLIFSLNNNLENYFDLRKKLLIHNESAIAIIKANYSNLESTSSFQLFPKDGAITTVIKTTDWGAFKQSQIISYSKKDSIQQGYLLSNAHHKDTPALYLRDNDEDFKISGKTLIIGDIYISSRGIKKVNILGQQSQEKPIHLGNVYTSEKNLPKNQIIKLIYPEDIIYMIPEDIKTDTISNGFDKRTKVIQMGSVIENIKLKGNIIVKSRDTLHVMNTAVLEDIIIEAPKVVFHSGFRGNLQVFASNEVIMDTNTILKFPSAIIVQSDNENENHSIIINQNSKINGNLILYGNGLGTEAKNKIVIESTSTVTGNIYCDGKLAIYGSVNGAIVTSALEHITSSTNHSNLILNASINSDSLPEPYFNFLPLEQFKTTYPIILKKI